MPGRALAAGAEAMREAPWWARWVLSLVSAMAATGGVGATVMWLTLPSRVDALEIRFANESSWTRGELVALKVQNLHTTCLNEWADDPRKDRACGIIAQRAEDILESQTRGSR